MVSLTNTAASHIRPVDSRRDLAVIANLIEICFADQMDEEGRAYIRQIRRAAQETEMSRWLPGADKRVTLPLGGYVWQENDTVVGNLTLIPFRASGHWRYLIANVAVHPTYRRRGIGRALTEKAVEHIHQRGADAWLQVREDNPPARQLYVSLGFQERACRTTWEGTNDTIPAFPSRMSIGRRRRQDWSVQEAWLRETYPPEVDWNLGFKLMRMRPGLWQEFLNFMFDSPVFHWAAFQGEVLAGVASWDPGPQHAENLWLAADPGREEESIFTLLIQARRQLATRRPLNVNYPAGRATVAFQQAGFVKQNTLIWMEKPRDENREQGSGNREQ